MNIRDRILRLDRVKASELLPNPRNWRKHPKAQQDAIRGILSEVGWVDALLVRETPAGLQIVDGHLRAEINPTEEVPVLVLDLSDSEADKVLATFDPLAAMAETNAENLDALLREVETGSEALASMLANLAKDAGCEWAKENGEVVEDEVPEPPAEAITKPGDLWILGEHRLLCGDSTTADSWERLSLPSDGGLCFTSPPYNLGASQKLSGNKSAASRGNAYVGHDDNQDSKSWVTAIGEVFALAIKYCESVIFNVQPLSGNRLELFQWLAGSTTFRDLITWDKGHAQPAMAGGVLDSRFEWLCVFSSGKQSRKIPLASWRGTVQNVYSAPGQRRNEFSEIHAATFPVHLPAWGMSTLCNLSRWCIDPYCGSGTTLIAAEQLGRRCFGMEISPIYCDVIVKRWENLTGKKATLEGAT